MVMDTIHETRALLTPSGEKWVILEAWYGKEPYYIMANDVKTIKITRPQLEKALMEGRLKWE